jgi:hypothetical protein
VSLRVPFDAQRTALIVCGQTALVWALNTLHLGFAMHIPWYYLVDGAGGKHDNVVVWSWPASIIVTVRLFLVLFAGV